MCSRAWTIAVIGRSRWTISGASMTDESAAVAGEEHILGAFHFGPEAVDRRLRGSAGANSVDETRDELRRIGGWMLADLGNRDALRERLHPALRDVLDDLQPTERAAGVRHSSTMHLGGKI